MVNNNHKEKLRSYLQTFSDNDLSMLAQNSGVRLILLQQFTYVSNTISNDNFKRVLAVLKNSNNTPVEILNIIED